MVAVPLNRMNSSATASPSGPPGAASTESACWQLRCDRVTRFFGAFPVLRGISFQLPGHRMIALFGPNGAGKSTILNILAGALKPSSGAILIGGHAVRSVAASRQTGLLSHQSLLHPTLTVRENLDFYAILYGVSDRPGAIRTALERVRGEHLADLRAGELSQGMKQKAALARCLLHAPRLLLLDEPFASLDRSTVAEMRRCFAELRDQGLTLLVSTHTDELITDLADGAITLERGKLVRAEGVDAVVSEAAR